MDILYLLIPVSVVLVFLVGAAFFWSLRSGQFDDLEGPAHRLLMDDDRSQAITSSGGRRGATAEPDSSDKDGLH